MVRRLTLGSEKSLSERSQRLKSINYMCPIFNVSKKDTGLDGVLIKVCIAVTKHSSVTRKFERKRAVRRGK